MHNLAPHLHGDHQVVETSLSNLDDEDGGLLDWMQGMFAQDLGEGHLEHCVTADNDNYNDLGWDVCPPSIGISYEEWLFVGHLKRNDGINSSNYRRPL